MSNSSNKSSMRRKNVTDGQTEHDNNVLKISIESTGIIKQTNHVVLK